MDIFKVCGELSEIGIPLEEVQYGAEPWIRPTYVFLYDLGYANQFLRQSE